MVEGRIKYYFYGRGLEGGRYFYIPDRVLIRVVSGCKNAMESVFWNFVKINLRRVRYYTHSPDTR